MREGIAGLPFNSFNLPKIEDPGNGQAIAPEDSGWMEMTVGDSENGTRTLSDPAFVGQILILSMLSYGTDAILSISVETSIPNQGTALSFLNVTAFDILIGISYGSALCWLSIYSNGVT